MTMRYLRNLLQPERCLFVPGVYDCLSARLAEAAGFEALAISGYSVEAAHLGLPDLGFVGTSDAVDVASRIVAATRVPVICDIDTGFGGPRNVWRTVELMARAGVAAVHIEDQASPKKCGAMTGRPVVPAAAMAEKIVAAKAAAHEGNHGGDMMIIARTDAKETEDVDAVIARLRGYLAAGADMVMLAEAYTADEMQRISRAVDGPLMACIGVPGWPATSETMATYARWGIRVALAPFLSIGPAARAMDEAFRSAHAASAITAEAMSGQFMSPADLNGHVGIDTWDARETRPKGSGDFVR